MKKIFIFSLFFLFFLGKSQEYSFDFLTNYTFRVTDKKFSKQTINYFNSDDFSYYLKVMYGSDHLTGTIYDSNTKKAHRFTITESKVKGEVFFSFTYDYSYDFSTYVVNKNSYIVFTPLPQTSPLKVEMKIYRNKKAKKPLSESVLTLKPANKNLFAMYRLSRRSFSDVMSNNSITGNYIVTNEIMKEGKIICEYDLKEYKNVELTLTLPKKLKF